jgi:hypothetical protein
MFFKLLNHSGKSLIRNSKFDLNFVFKLLSVFSIVYLFFLILYIGFNFEDLIHIYSPDLNPVEGLNSKLIYLFITGLLLLCILQRKISGDIIPYLHLPINRSKIISYILVLTLFNFFNLGFILFIVPFSVINVLPVYGIKYFFLYIAGIFLILMFVSYLALLLRNLINISSLFVLAPFVIIIIVFLLKVVFHISFEAISIAAFHDLLKGNISLIFIIFVTLIVLLGVNSTLLKNSIYNISSGETGTIRISNRSKPVTFRSTYIFYTLLEVKLIARNKRLNGFFIIAVGFIILFYYALQNNQIGLNFSFIIYILLSGMFGYMLSQYLFSWESSYFDFISSSRFDLLRYIKAKYLLYVSLGFIVFLFFLPLFIQKNRDLHLFLTALLYNSWVGYFIIFYTATFNSSRIDLNRNIFLNMQGWNNIQVVAVCVILFLPYAILLILTAFLSVTQSLLIINLLSLTSFLFRKKWFKIITKQLSNRKYINLEGYRK